MSKWEMVRLGDVCEVVSGSTPSTQKPELWDGNIKWVTPAELSEDSYFVYNTERHISEKAGLSPMPIGTVLLSSRAPIGKVAIAGEPMCCNQGFKNLICSQNIHNRYLYRYLKNQTRYLNSLGRGATFKEISKSIVENILIPLPPISTQQKIANVLDKINFLIEKRKLQIAKLDLLVKARFVWMFGNGSKWPSFQFGDICELKAGKFISASEIKTEFDEKLYPCYGGNGLRGYVDRYSHEGDYPLIGRQGALCGNIQYAKEKFYATEHAVVTCPKIKLDTQWLCYKLREINLNRLAIGAAQPGLTVEKLNRILIQLPPLPLQTQFADFVKQVDKTKFVLLSTLTISNCWDTNKARDVQFSLKGGTAIDEF